MSDLFLIAVDGSDAGKRALAFGAARAQAGGARVLLAHVLEWSPYSFLTREELAERHMRREQEMARADAAFLAPRKAELAALGLSVETVIRYGHVADALCDIAKEHAATQVFVGRTGQAGVTARLFGSVAGTLSQIAPVPCTIVP
ncbi:universal stress protein [Roseicitreum antarcticum]|uniref:Nucleotide-binding universal stress protein, UspA family n=1 Tax=Roseicitreum antarcticum TaxID=564137 RepID=A0A1H2SLR8_9RHOB|nr:universal stress protein [Roseicitreum antarcticum]SDW32562.1 Nucleotide-binding universal stress protein, UspA family [Roseicitreum antarcticum]